MKLSQRPTKTSHRYPIHLTCEFDSAADMTSFMHEADTKLKAVVPLEMRVVKGKLIVEVSTRMPDREHDSVKWLHSHKTFIGFISDIVQQHHHGRVTKVHDSTVMNDGEPIVTAPATYRNPDPALAAKNRAFKRDQRHPTVKYKLAAEANVLRLVFPTPRAAKWFATKVRRLLPAPGFNPTGRYVVLQDLPEHLYRQFMGVAKSFGGAAMSLALDFDVSIEKRGGTVKKSDIARAISDEMSMAKYRVTPIVQQVIDQIALALLNGQRVELRNFGVFEMRIRKNRVRQMPGTDITYMKPAGFYVHFKPSKKVIGPRVGVHAALAFPGTSVASVPSQYKSSTGRPVIIDVSRLIMTTQQNPVIKRKISELIPNVNRSSRTGFGKKRYANTDVKYPILIDKYDNVLDGRHRLFKLRDQGEEEVSCRVVTTSQLNASLILDASRLKVRKNHKGAAMSTSLSNELRPASPIGKRAVSSSDMNRPNRTAQNPSGVRGNPVVVPEMPTKPHQENGDGQSDIRIYFEGEDLADEASLWLRQNGVKVHRPFAHSHLLRAVGPREKVNECVERFKGSPVSPQQYVEFAHVESAYGGPTCVAMAGALTDIFKTRKGPNPTWKPHGPTVDDARNAKRLKGQAFIAGIAIGTSALTAIAAMSLYEWLITQFQSKLDSIRKSNDKIYVEATSPEVIERVRREAVRRGATVKDEAKKAKAAAFAATKTPEEKLADRAEKEHRAKEEKEHGKRTIGKKVATDIGIGIAGVAGYFFIVEPLVMKLAPLLAQLAVSSMHKWHMRTARPGARPSPGQQGQSVPGVVVKLTPQQLAQLKPAVQRAGGSLKKIAMSHGPVAMGLSPGEVVEFVFANSLAVAAGLAYLRSKGLAARRNGQKSVLCKVAEKSDALLGGVFRHMDKAFEATVKVALPGTEFLPGGGIHEFLPHEARAKLKKGKDAVQDVKSRLQKLPGQAARVAKALPGAVREAAKQGPGAFVPRNKKEAALAITVVFATAALATAAAVALKKLGVEVKSAGNRLFARPGDQAQQAEVERVAKDNSGQVRAASFMAEEIANTYEFNLRTRAKAASAAHYLAQTYGLKIQEDTFTKGSKLTVLGLKLDMYYKLVSMFRDPNTWGMTEQPKNMGPTWGHKTTGPGAPGQSGHPEAWQRMEPNTPPGEEGKRGKKTKEPPLQDMFEQLVIDFGALAIAVKAEQALRRAGIDLFSQDGTGKIYVTIKRVAWRFLQAIITAFRGKVVRRSGPSSKPIPVPSGRGPGAPKLRPLPSQAKATPPAPVVSPPRDKRGYKVARASFERDVEMMWPLVIPAAKAVGWWLVKDVAPYVAMIVVSDLAAAGITARLRPDGTVEAKGDPAKIDKVVKRRERKARIVKDAAKKAASFALPQGVTRAANMVYMAVAFAANSYLLGKFVNELGQKGISAKKTSDKTVIVRTSDPDVVKELAEKYHGEVKDQT